MITVISESDAMVHVQDLFCLPLKSHINEQYILALNKWEAVYMWNITLYEDVRIKMFEFDTENEAKEVYKNLKGNKYFSYCLKTFFELTLMEMSLLHHIERVFCLQCVELLVDVSILS